MPKNHKVAVLGGGLWGTVLAHHLAQKKGGLKVWLWEFFDQAAKVLNQSRRHPGLPGIVLHNGVTVASDMSQVVSGAETVLFVLPSEHMRKAARQAAQVLRGLGAKGRPFAIVNASKGIEPNSLLTMGEVVESEIKNIPVYTLSGPSFAAEVARGVTTWMILAGPENSGTRERLRGLLEGANLTITESSDRKGVELGGSLKNVLAIGCGIIEGLPEGGANAKAAFITQGVAEMAEIIVKCGGRAETAWGPAALGDFIATGTSGLSRNRTFGEKLGKGMSAEAAVKEIASVVEGIAAVDSAHALAAKASVKAPAISAVWKVLRQGAAARSVVQVLGR